MVKIKNGNFRKKRNTNASDEVLEESKLEWLGRLKRMKDDKASRNIYKVTPLNKKCKCRPRKIGQENIEVVAKKGGKGKGLNRNADNHA